MGSKATHPEENQGHTQPPTTPTSGDVPEKACGVQVRGARGKKEPLVAVVGPCASGKSSLVHALRERGYNAREVAQEHSHVPAMWKLITQPDLLIYLDVSWPVACQRRRTDAKEDWWVELARRLSHARQHADVCIDTDRLAPEEVAETAVVFLERVAPQTEELLPSDVAGLND